jgi:tryptophanyl-tRNA synthetase
MNNKFGELFVIPEENKKQVEFAGRTEPVRIRSLRNPDKKMSKSIEDPAGTIMLTDKPDDAAAKVMSATTDSHNRIPSNEEERSEQPGVTNLMLIKALLTGNMSPPEGNTEGYEFLKKGVAEAVSSFLTDFQAKLTQVDESKLLSKLEQDETAMNQVANAKLLEVQKAIGLRPSK